MSDCLQGKIFATDELLAGVPENFRPAGINSSAELSERGGEPNPGARNGEGKERASSVRESGRDRSWRPPKRNSSSRLASVHGESGE